MTPDPRLAANAPPPTSDPLRATARLYRAWAVLKPEWVQTLPPPPTDGAPHPTLRRRPRPPHVPAPPPHLDPDRTPEERRAAYEVLLAEPAP